MRLNKPAPLPQHYYLNNFRVLVDFVYHNYRSILSATEADFYTTFVALPENSQQLYIRLLLRRRQFVRDSKICYPEIHAVESALQSLNNAGFITLASEAHAAEWINLFNRSETPPVLQDNPSTGQYTTKDLFGDSPLDLLTRHESVYQVLHKETYLLYSLLFFGNLHQDLSEFVLTDLGYRYYEPYLTDTSVLPFHCREQLLAYWQYYQCAEAFDECVIEGAQGLLALYRQRPQHTHNDPVLTRRVENFSNKIARQLEREQACDEAISIYRTNQRPPARERLARLLEKQGLLQEALDECNAITSNPATSEELEFAEQFSVKLGKKLGNTQKNSQSYKPPEISLTFPPASLSVERITALHYAKTGACYYVENSLIVSIFGLAMWDVIFQKLPGVFYHPFQYAPADFHDMHFRPRRQHAFDNRIQQIKNGELFSLVLTCFHRKRGTLNPLVNWRALKMPLLNRALNIVPTADWVSLFEYLLRDIKHHRSGLPDLIYFPDRGGYQLLEVKGPGDQLQKHQRRWMKHFSQCNIEHAVVNVDYQRLSATTTSHTPDSGSRQLTLA